jgi:hypothetical protein
VAALALWAAMIKNLVALCVVAALIFMILLSYAQEHLECRRGHILRHGHIIETLKPCGSVDTSE